MPGLSEPTLIFDGVKSIPRIVLYCESCSRWHASSVERRQIEELVATLRLVAAVPHLTDARIEHADRPDIHLHLGDRVYGLEVTRIVRGGEQAIAHAEWRRAVERNARLMWRARHATPVWVSMYWNPEPPRADVDAVAASLVEVVEGHIATMPRRVHTWLSLNWSDLPDDVTRFVHAMTIVRTHRDDHWVSGFSNYPDVQPNELRGVIDSKRERIAGYTPPDDGLWLLIYAEAVNAAQALDLSDEALAATYSGPFSRVFFLDCVNKAADLRLSDA